MRAALLTLLLGGIAASCGNDTPPAAGDDSAEINEPVAEAPDGAGPGAGAESVNEPPHDAEPGSGTEPRQRDEPWITQQPRMDELRRRTTADFGWSPGTTEWRPASRPVPGYLTEAHVREHGGPGSPGELMALLSLETGVFQELHIEGRQEVTIRATQTADDAATGVLLYFGALDDSVAGSDLRATLRSVNGSWYVEQLEERFHCARRVAGDRCA